MDDNEAAFKLAFGADIDATASDFAVVSNIPLPKNEVTGGAELTAVEVATATAGLGGTDEGVLGGLDDAIDDDDDDDDAGLGLLLLSLLACGGADGEGLSLLSFCCAPSDVVAAPVVGAVVVAPGAASMFVFCRGRIITTGKMFWGY